MSATLGPLINRSKPDTTIIIYFRQQDGVYRPAPELGDRLTAKELQGNPYPVERGDAQGLRRA